MNRSLFLSISALLIMAAGFCKNENPRQKGSESAVSSDSREPIRIIEDSLRLDSLFDLVRRHEIAVAENPSGRSVQNELIASSFDTLTECFFIVGQGIKDTALPEDARPRSQTIAAKYSAEKWALYCKAWRSGEKIDYGGSISGQVLYAKHLRERVSGDTLFVFFMVPVGSVVLK